MTVWSQLTVLKTQTKAWRRRKKALNWHHGEPRWERVRRNPAVDFDRCEMWTETVHCGGRAGGWSERERREAPCTPPHCNNDATWINSTMVQIQSQFSILTIWSMCDYRKLYCNYPIFATSDFYMCSCEICQSSNTDDKFKDIKISELQITYLIIIDWILLKLLTCDY